MLEGRRHVHIGLLIGASVAVLGIASAAVAIVWNTQATPMSIAAESAMAKKNVVTKPKLTSVQGGGASMSKAYSSASNTTAQPKVSSENQSTVTINGHTVSKSGQGSIHQVVTSDNGQASVAISAQSDQSDGGGTNTSNTSVNVSVQ